MPAASDHTGQALITHQPIHRAPRHSMALTAQIRRHLASPIHALRRADRGPQRVGEWASVTVRSDGAAVFRLR